MAKSILINIIANPAQAIEALSAVGLKAEETAGKTETIGKSSESTGSKMASFGKVAAMGLVGVGAAAVELGNKLEDAHVMLVTAVKDAGGNMSALGGQIASTDASMEKFGDTNAQTESALATMTIGLHNPTEAMRLMGLAADIAKARHIDLAAASTLVVKASEGQTMALRRAGIDLPIMASGALKVKTAQTALAAAQQAVNAILLKAPDAMEASSKAHAKYLAAMAKVSASQTKLAQLQSAGGQIIDALTKRYSGQAAAAADTFSGKLDVTKARVEDLGARLGTVLIPFLEKVALVVSTVVTWLTKHKAVAEGLAIVIGVVVVAALAAFVVGLFAAEGALAFMLGPVGLIIVAVAALALGIVYLATHWKQTWDNIKRWVHDGYVWVQQHFLLIMAIPLIGWMLAIAVHWKGIWDGIRTVVSDAVGWITGAWRSFIGFFTGIPGTVASIASGMWDGISGAFKTAINTIIGWWDTFVSYLKIPSFHIGFSVFGHKIGATTPSFDLGSSLQIPMLAAGGTVMVDGLAYIHAGEQVVPAAQVASGTSGGGSSGSDVPVQLVLDGRVVGTMLWPYLRTQALQGSRRNATRIGFA